MYSIFFFPCAYYAATTQLAKLCKCVSLCQCACKCVCVCVCALVNFATCMQAKSDVAAVVWGLW